MTSSNVNILEYLEEPLTENTKRDNLGLSLDFFFSNTWYLQKVLLTSLRVNPYKLCL